MTSCAARVALAAALLATAPAAAMAQAPSASRQAADAVAAGVDPVEVLFDGEQRTLDCGGRGLALMGSGNTLTLRGRCPRVNVSGSDNLLTVDDPTAIVVTGDRNQVNWAGAQAPRVTDTGRQNRLGPARP